MHILIFLFLLTSCLIYCGNAAGNTNQIDIASVNDPNLGDATVRKRTSAGGQTEQDPNEPKYKKMAEELVRNNLRIKDEDIRNIKVNTVTTQVVKGTMTRIEIRIILVSGFSDQCNFQVWNKPWLNEKDVTYKCLKLNQNKVLKGINATPRPEQSRDPKDPKYQKLAKASIDYLFKTLDRKPFKKEDICRINVTKVKVKISSKITINMQFNVITINNDNYQCTGTILEKPWNPNETTTISFVNCSFNKVNKLSLDASPSKLNQNVPGGEVDENPDDPKYIQLAKESFQRYMNTYSNGNVQVKSIKIDRATSQLVAGTIIRLHFHVFPTRGAILQCQSEIYEKLGPGRNLDFDVSCNSDSGGEVEKDPNDPQYQQLAKESFQWYKQSHRDVNVKVKSIEIESVTTQVVAGRIIRIHFQVHPTRGSTFLCQSQIFEGVGSVSNVDFVVSCNRLIGGEVVEDPDDPKYQPLAKQSFEWYLNFNNKDNVQVKGIKIDLVTSQVVAGKIIRIHFHVYPTRGSTFICKSKIFEGVGWQPNLDFVVSCNNLNGGEEERDPDDPKYQQLGKESFSKYQETHMGLQYAVKELKVTRATSQVVAGIIIQLDFDVITTNDGKFICHSKIFEQRWIDFKTIDVNCLNTAGVMKLTARQSSLMRLTAKQSAKSKADFVGEAVKEYLQDINKGIYFDRSETKSVRTVTTRVAKQKITYYEVEAVRHTVRGDYSNFHCSVLTGSWFEKEPFATNCIKHNSLMGRSEWMDPTNKEYLSFAEKSLQLYLKDADIDLGPRDYAKYDIIVTFVTQGVVAGRLDNINFLARWVHGNDDDPTVLKCHTEIWEKLNGKNVIEKVSCNSVSWGRN